MRSVPPSSGTVAPSCGACGAPRRLASPLTSCRGSRPNRYDRDQVLQAPVVGRVGGVERNPGRGGDGRDHQVGEAAPGLATRGEDRRGDHPERPSGPGVERQRLQRPPGVLEHPPPPAPPPPPPPVVPPPP